MGRYYEIIPIADKYHTISDAIDKVAATAGIKYSAVMRMLGFSSDMSMFRYLNQNEHPHFNKNAYMAVKLNDICKALDLSLRVIRPPLSLKGKEQ